jgi:hypothetical protein
MSEGPTKIEVNSCELCEFINTLRWGGKAVSKRCNHPALLKNAGDLPPNMHTPAWCPFLKKA